MKSQDFNKSYDETVVQINRCTNVTKGGKTLSFSALIVVGDRNGTVGYGFGKSRNVPNAVEKATKDARKQMHKVVLKNNTIPHEVFGKYLSSQVFMKPATRGTGIKAGASVRAILELAGVKDVLTKCYGNRNPINVVKAAMECLLAMRNKEEVAKLRGVTIK
ncbi:MAG: 30S ribosomal protein S5 [Candidatus Anammoxibacter sp.]